MLDGRLRSTVERGLAPAGRGLPRVGISADVLTVVGLLVSAATAVLLGAGQLRWAVLGISASGLTDLLDGAVARNSGQASSRGAFFDSVTDRVSDALVLGGVAWYFAGKSAYLPLLAFAAVALSMLISYERARAEALGYSARGGLMERAERMVLLGVASFFHVLEPALWLMVALMAFTAAQRFVKVWRQASAERPEKAPPRSPRSPRAPRTHHERSRSPRRAPADQNAGAPGDRTRARWWELRAPRAAAARRAARAEQARRP